MPLLFLLCCTLLCRFLLRYLTLVSTDLYTLLCVFLRRHLHASMGKSLAELPPILSSLHGHLLLSPYFIFLSTSLLIGNTVSIDACSYGWEWMGSVFFPSKYLNMPHEYYITCGCIGCTRNCGCRSVNVSCTEYCKCSNNCKSIS